MAPIFLSLSTLHSSVHQIDPISIKSSSPPPLSSSLCCNSSSFSINLCSINPYMHSLFFTTHNLNSHTNLPICPINPLFVESITPGSRILFRNPNFVRNFCSWKKSDDAASSGWTEEIEYLDESGSVMFTEKGIRSMEPGVDAHVMVGDLKKPFLNASAVAKIVEVVKRWKWGPDLETQLDKLQFVPNMIHITQALKIIGESDASLSLFRWAKRQGWYAPNDECYMLLFDRLNESRDFDGIQSLFDEMIRDSSDNVVSSFSAYNQVIQHLAKAKKLEVSFCCFKKIQDSGCKIDTKIKGYYGHCKNVFPL